MRYDRGDIFPFDCEPNGILIGSKSKGKPSPRSYPIQFGRKRKYSFLRVGECPENGVNTNMYSKREGRYKDPTVGYIFY